MAEFRCIFITRATEKANLIRVADREIWLPKSVVKRTLKFKPDSSGQREAVVEAEDWWCEKNNL